MEKESVKKFDLEAAFKALDEIEIPAVEGKGRTKANRVDLKERFSHKPATETLVEDYYDVSSTEDLEEAKEEREGEVAQAKLARIEKIVDLDAETADDLLPSYVGKVIMQCPQCMTLFYKNPEDIEHSEENPDVVNINEICQHCGNSSGYTLIGKVDSVGAEEADKYEEAPVEENELDLDFSEPTEEVSPEGTEEEANEGGEEELDLDLNLEEVPAEEEKNESLNLSKETSEHESENKSENVTLNEEVDKDLDEKLKAHNEYIEYLRGCITEKEEALKKAENEEIKALIEKCLEALHADLEAALPDAVKEEAPVEEVPEVAEEESVEEPVEEEPVEEVKEEEIVEEEPVEEALTEEVNPTHALVYADAEHTELSDRWLKVGSKEELEKLVEKNKDKPSVIEHGGLKVIEIPANEKEVEESLNNSEATSENESENNSENLTLNENLKESAESEIDSIIASWGGIDEGLTEESSLDRLLDSEEFKTPVTDAEIEAARKEAQESLEECNKQTLKEEPEDTIDPEIIDIVNSWDNEPAEEPVEEGIGSAIGSVVSGIGNGVKSLLASDEAEKKDCTECEEGLGTAVANVATGVGAGLVNLLASDEGEKATIEEDAIMNKNDSQGRVDNRQITKPEEKETSTLPTAPAVAEEIKEDAVVPNMDFGGININLDASGQNNAVGFGGSQPKVESCEGKDCKEEVCQECDNTVKEGLPGLDSLPVSLPSLPGLGEELEDLDESSFNTHVNDYLTEVYENVAKFEATSCELKEGKLFVEGKISFKSGKEKLTMFEFLPNYGEGKLFFEGINKDFSEDKAFTLNCSLKEGTILTEGFGYKYKINETLVEGLK